MLENFLQTSGIAACEKDADGRVLRQNDACKRLCGDCQGQRCEQGCMALYNRDATLQWSDWGSRVYPNSRIRDAFFDVTLLRSAGRIVTLLTPLKDKYEQALAYYREKGLTRRENEVVSLLIREASNADICKSLSISRATLRSHLNNIYRKFRDMGEAPAFIPANRWATYKGNGL